MTLISRNVYIDKLDNIVNKYKHTYHIDDDFIKRRRVVQLE